MIVRGRIADVLRFALTAAAIAGASYTAAAFNGTSDPYIAIFMPLLIVTVGALLWPGLRDGWRVPASGVAIGLVAFYVYLCLSTLWSTVPYISHLFALLFSCLPLLFFGLTMAQRPDRACLAALCGMGATWAGLALYALVQFFILPRTAGHRIAAPMLDPNNLAAFFNMGALMAAGGFIAARGRAWRVAAASALFALMLLASFSTMSRAGLVILALGLVALAALERRALLRQRWKVAVYALLPVVLFALIDVFSHSWYTHTFAELGHPGKSPSVNDRHALLVGSVLMLRAHPWGDIGLGNFYYFYPAYRLSTDMSDGFFAHSDPLQLALETGLPVLVFFYGLLAALAWRWRAALRVLPEGQARSVAAASGVALASILLHAHINYNLYMPGLLIPAGILLAIGHVATGRGFKPQILTVPAPRHRPYWAACALIAGVALAALWPVRIGLTSALLDRVTVLVNDGQADKAVALADALMRYGDAGNFSVSEMRARMALDDVNAAAPSDRAVTLQRGLGYIQLARNQNPAFTTFMSLEAQFYFLGRNNVFPGGLEKAQNLLERAVPLNPLDVDSREGLAVVYQAEGRAPDALRVMGEGTRWPRPKGQPDVNFYVNLARAYRLVGDDANADNAMTYAAARAAAYGLPSPQ